MHASVCESKENGRTLISISSKVVLKVFSFERWKFVDDSDVPRRTII